MTWLRRIPVPDLVLSALLLVVAAIEATFLTDFGPLPAYWLNLLIHLGLVAATAVRRVLVVPSFLATYALLAALALLVRWAPVNLGVSPALFCAPLALLAITRHGPTVRWGWAALLLGVAGSFASPAQQFGSGGYALVAVHILVLVGCYLWSSQQRTMADRYAADLAEQQHRQRADTQRVIEAERLDLAREVHDMIAHNLAVVQVQAATALAIGSPDRMRESLSAIREVSRTALDETRALVGVLRDPTRSTPHGDLAELAQLADRARAAGVRLTAELPDDVTLDRWQRWPAALRLAVLRVVRESLTNVIRHGGPEPVARLVLSADRGNVRIEVVNDRRDDRGEHGHGLTGLAERVKLVDGTLTAGPHEAGFRVLAEIPVMAETPVGGTP